MSRRLRRPWAALIVATTILASCGPRPDNSRIHLTPPSENTTVGAGDVFTMQIVGEAGLPSEYQISPDGNVNLPYVHLVHVEGLEPQEISELIRKRFIDAKILSDPSVIVRVREYNSKHVIMLGQVARPGRFAFSAGMTLVQAISMAGGFTAVAKHNQVSLKRKTEGGGTKTVIVSVDAIIEGDSQDIVLQAGDQVYVPERVF